jgi:3-oxo-5alpha-steroid 4-dehydrogenase
MALTNPLAPTLSLALGGLRVDENTSGVLHSDGRTIGGLYADGCAAVGGCSNGYPSGMSLADCLFSGRRAGATIAKLVPKATGRR